MKLSPLPSFFISVALSLSVGQIAKAQTGAAPACITSSDPFDEQNPCDHPTASGGSPSSTGPTKSSGGGYVDPGEVFREENQAWSDTFNQFASAMAAEDVARAEEKAAAEKAVAEEVASEAGIAYSVVARDQMAISVPTQHDIMDDFADDAAILEADFSSSEASPAPDPLTQIADADPVLQEEENSTQPSDSVWQQAWQKVKDAPQEIAAKASALLQQGVDGPQDGSNNTPEVTPSGLNDTPAGSGPGSTGVPQATSPPLLDRDAVAEKLAETGLERVTDKLADESGLQGKLATANPVEEGMRSVLGTDSEESEAPETIASWSLDKVKDAIVEKASDYLAEAKSKLVCGGGGDLDTAYCRIGEAANPINLAFDVKQYMENIHDRFAESFGLAAQQAKQEDSLQ